MKSLWLLASLAAGAQEVTLVTLLEGGVVKVEEGPARARRRLSPCSTFKIPNAVIGLETGAIPSPSHVIPFDPARHRSPGFWLEAWSRDHDLGSAFRASAVWYFKDLAARVGPANMRAFLDRFDYGNRDATGWPEPFWIGGPLRISPVEHVEFLDRLFRNAYGLTPANVATVEAFMRQPANGPRELYFKTGACTDRDAGLTGWVVGFVREPGRRRHYFAFNAAFASMASLMEKRTALFEQSLRRAGLN
jgi:beta-lactamase class D